MATYYLHLFLAVFMISTVFLCHCAHGAPAQSCRPFGYIVGTAGHCNQDNDAECCQAGTLYPQYRCSPPVTRATKAHMTINNFDTGGDRPSGCDDRYHNNNERIVALSTGWYKDGNRCLKDIRIHANGRSVLAKVVDECDSVNGCDAEHDYQPPCGKYIVDASPAVWDALGIPQPEVGGYDVTWSDA